MSTYRPLHDNVLVQLVEVERKTATGIIIPTEGKLARVVEAGAGRITEQGALIEPRVKKGDIVSLPTHFDAHFQQDGRLLAPIASEVLVDGRKHYVLREQYILGVIDGWTPPEKG
jgi:chaperonin GroES